jgi:hypothetical protein
LLERLLATRTHVSTENCPLLPQNLPNQPNQPISGFATNAKWVELKKNEAKIEEPNRQYTNLVGPTVPAGQSEAPKYNFDEAFDWPPLIGTSKVVKLNHSSKPVHDWSGNKVFEEGIREDGRANLE